MTTSATQPGVQTNDAGDDTTQATDATVAAETIGTVTERELSPRERAMAEIAASRRQQFEQESGIKLEADPDVDTSTYSDQNVEPAVNTDQVSAGADADQVNDQITAQLAEEPKVLSDGLDKVKVRVKIDGEEREVTVADMQRQYQKNSTADRRLEEATRLLREAQEAQLRLQGAQTGTPNTTTPEVSIDPEVGKKFTAAIKEGDEDTANRAFAEALSRAVQAELAKGRSNATPDPMTIAQQVKQQLVVESALEQSKRDYPQLYADPDIEALGATKIQRRMEEDGLSFADALNSVATELSDKFGWQKPGRQAAANPTTTRDEKLARKAGIDNIPAANVKSTTTEPPPKTHSDIIAEMRNRRPGQVL